MSPSQEMMKTPDLTSSTGSTIYVQQAKLGQQATTSVLLCQVRSSSLLVLFLVSADFFNVSAI